MTNSQEALNLTTTIRVKTPPTVEMVEPSQDLGDQEQLVKDEAEDVSENNDEKAEDVADAAAGKDSDEDEQPPTGKAETEEEESQPEVGENQPSSPDVTSSSADTPSNDASVSGDEAKEIVGSSEASAQAVPVNEEVAVKKDEDDLYDNPLLIDVSSYTEKT